MRRRVNWKLFLPLLAASTLLSVGVHLLHAYQAEKSSRTLREQAAAALAAEEYEKAGHYLTRYLAFHPSDSEALTKYGHVHLTQRKTEWALKAFKQVVVLDPSDQKVRRIVVDLALRLGHHVTAAAHAHELLSALSAETTPEAAKQCGDLERILGKCHEAKKLHREAAEAFGRATQHAPALVEPYVRRAALLRERLNQAQQADQVITALVKNNPDSFRAYYERGRYRERWQQPDAGADLQHARTLLKGARLHELEDFLAASDLAQSAEDLDASRGHLVRAVKQFPNEPRLVLRLARLELRAGQAEKAVSVLQTGLMGLPNDRDFRVALVEALFAAGKGEEAERDLTTLRKSKRIPGILVEYLDAYVLVRKQQWAEASRSLESIRERLTFAPEFRVEADQLLIRCYERLGDHELYFATLQRTLREAAKGGARTGAARYRLGQALLAVGRVEDAISEFSHAVSASDAPPQAWLRLAEATLLRALRLSANQRESVWEEIEQQLAHAAQAMPDAVEVLLLRAELLAAQGKLAAAEAHVRKARDKQPQKIELWNALVAIMSHRGTDPVTIRSVLDNAQRRLGDSADVRLLRARYWANRGGGEARAALAELKQNVDKFSVEEQPQLLAGLAEAFQRVGEPREAELLWRLYLEQKPQNLRVRQLLFEQALSAGDRSGMEKAVADLKEAEGEEGVYWRSCAAVALLARGRAEGAQTVAAEVRGLVEEIRQRRAKWARVAVLEGELAELEGKLEEAVVKYQQAIDQGERSPRVIQRTVELLNQTKQYRAGDQLIARLSESAVLGDALRWLTAETALRANDFDRAEAVARAAVAANSEDYRRHLWLGQVLAAAGKLEAAEEALLRATDLGKTAPEAWIVLVQLQVRRDRSAAEATIQKVRERVPAELIPLTLGPCLEALGEREQAQEQYQTALAARPTDPTVMRVVALFHLRDGQPMRAEEILRKMISPGLKVPEPLAAWARRALAVTMAGPDYQRFKQGLRFLEENIQQTGGSALDQRARAVLLDRPGHRLEAIQVLEELAKVASLALSDQFALARLYEAVGNWSRADELLGPLTTVGNDPTLLAHHARGHLRHGEPGKARALVVRLEKGEPAGLTTLELKARLLHAEGQAENATALFELVIRDTKEPAVLGMIAVLLEELGQTEAAEKLYRQFAERSKLPESALSLARFLGRQGRVKEGLNQCEQLAALVAPEVLAEVIAGMIRTGKGTVDQAKRAEGWLVQAITAGTKAKSPQVAALLGPLADVYDYQGRYADAMKTYRQMLALNPNDFVACNNLAWLLVMEDRKGSTEALKYINHAIDNLRGPMPTLLDTRATVFTALGRSGEAIQDLQTALSEAQTPVRYVHLALAYRMGKKRTEAREALETARAMGFDPANLHPLEQPAYRTLRTELGIK